MTRALALGTVFLGLSACASNPPEQAQTVVERDAVAATPASSNAQGGSGAQPVTAGSAPAAASSASEEGLHVVAVPTVAKTATAAPQVEEDHPDELVCRREKTTGSHRVTRVCRTRSQIEQERDASQKMVRDAIRSPDGSKLR